MQALASERPLAREAGWDQKPSGESRLGYDGNEGIYFDRTKTTDEVGEDGEPLFEEADPEEICYEIEQERDALKTRLKQAIGHIDDMTAALTRANLQPQEPEGMRDGVENTPPRVDRLCKRLHLRLRPPPRPRLGPRSRPARYEQRPQQGRRRCLLVPIAIEGLIGAIEGLIGVRRRYLLEHSYASLALVVSPCRTFEKS